jgi:prophage regulatory protein
MRLLRISEVIARTGLSRSTINRLRQRRLFPRPRMLTSHAIGWTEASITKWIRGRRMKP